MSTIMPKGENIRRAVKWISDNKQDAPDANLKKLVQEASLKFNLTPGEQEYLVNFYKDHK
jgi:hypothetical protein